MCRTSASGSDYMKRLNKYLEKYGPMKTMLEEWDTLWQESKNALLPPTPKAAYQSKLILPIVISFAPTTY